MATVSEAENHQLIAGNLGLDFANTVNGHTRQNPHEYLKSYRDLVLWARHAGTLSPEDAHALLREAERHPVQAAKAYARALALRESIYRVFAAQAHGSRASAADLGAINTARSQALAHSQIAPSPSGFAWDWTEKASLDRVVWPIVLSGADLLISGDLERVRSCAGEGCDWLFVDNSRNHLRRWCSMDECGNRAKAKRFLERRRRLVRRRQSGSSAH